MVNPFARVDWSPDRAAIRSFAKTVAIGMPIVALVYSLLGRVVSGGWPLTFAASVCAAGVVLAATSAVLPGVGRWIYRTWYAVACTVGFVTANSVLAVIFFAVLAPLGIARRLTGSSPVLRAPNRAAATYWVTPAPTDGSSYDQQY